jgi:NADPH:quinone reductase
MAVLPHDTYGRDWGLLVDQKLPAVLGNNIAGVIKEVGSGSPFQVGDKVFGISSYVPTSSDQCGLQEYAVLNANAIALIPTGSTDEQVVSFPINLVTSAAVLFTKTGFDLSPPYLQQEGSDLTNKTVVIVGGGTNVGQFATQLARIAGIGKIIVVAGAANFDKLMLMGATHTIDRNSHGRNIADQIRGITGGDGATMVYNCAPLDLDLAIGSISASRPSVLRLLLPLEEDQLEKIKAQRPRCDAAFVDDLTNESLAPHAAEFWKYVSRWVAEGFLVPAGYRIVHGLERVDEINAALDAYQGFSRVGAQSVVKILGTLAGV